ncbi:MULTISPECIES: hypothetical protein [unclassified Sulfitobacter]|uniref:hypothetical protein n=1 Tax=unclassified Sulfitobacter TaxID=196795 RepID=UPI0037451816
MQVKHRDYSNSYTAIKVFEAFGMLVVGIGVIVALYGISKVSAVPRSGNPPVVAAIIAALPGAGIAIAGTVNLVLAKMAEASVHTAEMTQQLLQIAIRRGDDDRSEPSPRQGNRTTTYGRSAAQKAKASLPDAAPVPNEPTPTLVKAKEPAKPKPLRPLGGDKPDQADGDVVETHRDVKIYKRETGIFIGSQWYPGVDAAKQAIDQHAKEKG